MLDKKIFLPIDEYGYGVGSLKADLAYAVVLNEMFRHTGFLKMAAYTMAVSTLDVTGTGAVYNARWSLNRPYRDHFGTLPVAVSGNPPSRRRSIHPLAISRRQVLAAPAIRSPWRRRC
jgi:alpha-N-arabinofuranosidase